MKHSYLNLIIDCKTEMRLFKTLLSRSRIRIWSCNSPRNYRCVIRTLSLQFLNTELYQVCWLKYWAQLVYSTRRPRQVCSISRRSEGLWSKPLNNRRVFGKKALALRLECLRAIGNKTNTASYPMIYNPTRVRKRHSRKSLKRRSNATIQVHQFLKSTRTMTGSIENNNYALKFEFASESFKYSKSQRDFFPAVAFVRALVDDGDFLRRNSLPILVGCVSSIKSNLTVWT